MMLVLMMLLLFVSRVGDCIVGFGFLIGILSSHPCAEEAGRGGTQTAKPLVVTLLSSLAVVAVAASSEVPTIICKEEEEMGCCPPSAIGCSNVKFSDASWVRVGRAGVGPKFNNNTGEHEDDGTDNTFKMVVLFPVITSGSEK